MSEPEPSEHAETEDALAGALRARRPTPGRPFGDQLREQLLAEHARSGRPPRLRALVLAHLLSGTLLLIVAALLA